MTPSIAAASDAGAVEDLDGNWLDVAISAIEAIPENPDKSK